MQFGSLFLLTCSMEHQLLGLPLQLLGDFWAPISFIFNVDELSGNWLLNNVNEALC